jgi:hypothetical protein
LIISRIVDDQVIILSTVARVHALDLDSVMCLGDRSPIGRVCYLCIAHVRAPVCLTCVVRGARMVDAYGCDSFSFFISLYILFLT